jgi:SAM-dependent methyltransferase
MHSFWQPTKPVEGAFALSDGVVHNAAALSGCGPVMLVTDSRQWSYAAAFPLRAGIIPHEAPGAPLLVRVEMTVHSGCIGAIFVADDLQTVLGTVAEEKPQGSGRPLEIVIDPAPASGWLILRNHAGGGRPSRCSIDSLQAFLAEPRPATPTKTLQDILSPETGNIDMGKLSAIVAEARKESPFNGDPFPDLRQKWSEVPAGLSDRRRTTELAALSDEELLAFWLRVHEEATTGPGFPVRGWYQRLYQDVFRGKRVLDVGSGLGIDGLPFARQGAAVTFVDIVQSNLDLLRRLCRIFGLDHVGFHYLDELSSLESLPGGFDFIWCQGSMINAPFPFSQNEAEGLLRHLPVGGRWVELAYPRERWEREGCLPFNEWGAVTDGPGTPWMEWYDLQRLRTRLQPAEFDVVLHFNFHNDDFNWFDLIRRK